MKAQEESARHQEWAEKAEKDNRHHQKRADAAAQMATLNLRDLEAEKKSRADAQKSRADAEEELLRASSRNSHLEDTVTMLKEASARLEGKAAELEGKVIERDGKVAELEGKVTEREGKVTELEGKLAAMAPGAMATELAEAKAHVIAVVKQLQTEKVMHAEASKKHQTDSLALSDELKELRGQLVANERAPEEGRPAGAECPGAQNQLLPTEVVPAAPPALSGSETEEGGAGALTGAAAASTAAASTPKSATPKVLSPVQMLRRRNKF